MRNLILLVAMTTLLAWACSPEDDDEPAATNSTATTSSTAATPSTPAPMLVLATNTGDDEEDEFTTDATVTVTAEGGAEVVLSVTTNGEDVEFEPEDEPDPITMPDADEEAESTETTNDVNLLTYFGLSAPTGDDAIEFVLTAEATQAGKSPTEAEATLEFTLVSWPATITVSYDDDGTAGDGLTTESELTIGGFSEFEGTNIKLVSYVVTNADTTATTHDADQALTADYKLDMRDVRATLGAGERIGSLTFGSDNGHAHTTAHALSPGLAYYRRGRFERKFTTANNPYNIAITSDGVLLVTSEDDEDKVYFYDTNGNAETIRIDGSDESNFGSGSESSQFDRPFGVAVDDDGNIYVADHFNDRVQIFEEDFDYSTNITGLTAVANLFLHDDNLYVSAIVGLSYRIRTFALDDLQEGSNISGSGGYYAVAIDSNEVYHVINVIDDRVEAWTGSPSEGFTNRNHTYGLRTSSDRTSSRPIDVVVGPSTGRIYVSDIDRDQVVILAYDGDATTNQYTLVGVLGREDTAYGSRDGEFHAPRGLLIHGGKLYVVDKENNRVQVFTVPE